MHERHTQREINLAEQAYTTARYVLPFIEAHGPITTAHAVLEIGCGEGGNLEPLLDRGCRCVGIDLDAARTTLAARHFATHRHRDRLALHTADVHALPEIGGPFDLVMIRDALEHIPDPAHVFEVIGRLLAPAGRVFIGFPPWQHPFGGHQHHLASRLLARTPYWHLLPRSVCAAVLRAFGESPHAAHTLLALKDTGLTIEGFEAIARRQGFRIDAREHFLINPNFEIKFGLRPRRQSAVVRGLPGIRNFLTTTAYYVLTPGAGSPERARST